MVDTLEFDAPLERRMLALQLQVEAQLVQGQSALKRRSRASNPVFSVYQETGS